MRKSEEAKSVYIGSKKYEMEGLEGYPFQSILKILIRRKYLADDYGEVYWGLQGSSRKQEQVKNENLKMKISEFIRANLSSQTANGFYLKIAHSSNQQSQISVIQLPEQQATLPNKNENESISIQQNPIKQTSGLKPKSDIVNSPTALDQVQSNHLQQKDMQNVPLKILLNIIKKLYNHERLIQLQESMEKDKVPKQLIQSVRKLSKTIYERNVYLYEMVHLQKNIMKLIGNKDEEIKKEEISEIEIRTQSTQFLENSPSFLDREKRQQTEQCLNTLHKYINQLKQDHETQNDKLKTISQFKKDLQNRLIQLEKQSILSTPFFSRNSNKLQKHYLLRVLEQNKGKVRELNMKINYDKLSNIRYEHFTSLLGSFAYIENLLLILHVENAKIAVFCPKGMSGYEDSSQSKIGDTTYNTQVGFISELTNEVTHWCQLMETKKMIKIDDRKVSIEKQVIILLYNFKSRAMEVINNPNDNSRLKKQYEKLFAVMPKKSILKSFEIFQVIFDEK